jgi:alkylation response protein AidB-like acyl-CoA dehydrogenase
MTVASSTSEEHELLAESAHRLFEGAGGVSRARSLRDAGEDFSAELWASMAELGWLSIPIPTLYGGAGAGVGDMLAIFEAAGRVLSPEALLSTVLGSQLLALSGGCEHQERWLPEIGAGTAVVAVAGLHEYRSTHQPRTRIDIRPGGDSITIAGWASEVLDGNAATAFVLATASQGVVVVPRGTPGVRVVRQRLIDSRNWARVEFEEVCLPQAAYLVEPGEAPTPVERVIDLATVALCAEMLGAMWESFDRTLAYVKERVQFGRSIGSYQAVQHRLARLYTELLVTDAAVRRAGTVIDEPEADAIGAVSMAKARASATARLLARETIQFHGGFGVTDECDIGLFLKRLRLSEFLFGDESWHADRWAQSHAY